MTVLLGGAASPIGWSVQYLNASPADVFDAVRDARPGVKLKVRERLPYPESLHALPPFEAPWTRELLLPCGSWTAYLNNFPYGGDPTAIGPAIARKMAVRCVVAEHAPRYGPGHEATQLNVLGPQGVPPLMYVRTLSATATDGRWEWHSSGEPLAFEEPDRYAARRVRDRFDRQLLLRYLAALGIPADDDRAYGEGVLVQQNVRWQRRSVSLAEAKTWTA